MPDDSRLSAAAPAPRAEIVTFGCRLNIQESALIGELTAGRDDLVVVNTCAVTAEAERQARQSIRRLKREHPGKTIVVTGCAAQLHPERFAAMPEVARVVGNIEKLRAETWREQNAPRVAVADIMTVRESAHHLLDGYADQTRAFVEIQQGCDHRCTFCIIPFARGPSRSVPVEPLVAQARGLVARGYREIVLTGVDITSYGADLPERPSLGRLVRRLLEEAPALARLRLSSLDPAELDDELFAAARDGATPDAAPASEPAGRRRLDPQAHEAAPFARPGDRRRRARARRTPGRGARRRPDRRLSRPRPMPCSRTRCA